MAHIIYISQAGRADLCHGTVLHLREQRGHTAPSVWRLRPALLRMLALEDMSLAGTACYRSNGFRYGYARRSHRTNEQSNTTNHRGPERVRWHAFGVIRSAEIDR